MKKITSLSLMQKVIIVVTLCTTIPVIIGIIYSSIAAKDEIISILKNDVTQSASELQDEFDSYVRGIKTFQSSNCISGIIRAIENGDVDPFDGSLKSTWQKRFAEIGSHFFGFYKAFKKLDLIDDNLSILGHIKKSKSGNVLAASPELLDEGIKNENDSFLLETVLKPNKSKEGFYFKENFYWNNTDHIQIAAPVVDNKGYIQPTKGALVLTVTTESILNSIFNSLNSVNFDQFIIDSNQNIIAYRKEFSNEWEYKPLIYLPENTFLKIKQHPNQVAKVNNAYYIKSKPIYPIKFDKKYYWTYLISAPKTSVYYAALENVYFLIILMSCVLSCVILAGIIFSKGIVKPLMGIVYNLEDETLKIAAASDQLANSSQELSKNSQKQALSIQQVSSSLEVTSCIVQQNTYNAKFAAKVAKEASLAAGGGSKEMNHMVEAMHEINASSDEIANITKTIDEIAFQTNILAVNASVEAARAGSAGEGFAVVANEIRNLSQSCAQAANETAKKIEHSLEKSKNGLKIAQKVSDTLKNIYDRVHKMEKLVNEITLSSSEQEQNISQINEAVINTDQITQNNAASAKESASSVTQLNKQAEFLKSIAHNLKLILVGLQKNYSLLYAPKEIAFGKANNTIDLKETSSPSNKES